MKRRRSQVRLGSGLNQTGMTIIVVIPVELFGSLAVMVKLLDFRSMTLRRQVSLVLPFGQPVDPDHQLVLILDALALRRRVSPVLLLSAVWRSWSSSTLDP